MNFSLNGLRFLMLAIGIGVSSAAFLVAHQDFYPLDPGGDLSAAQNILASQDLQDMIKDRIGREWNTDIEHAGQVVPSLDLWVGRHELLYSRIFNS